MAVADTYNGDLVRIRQKVPEENDAFTADVTEAQEQATAYIDIQIQKYGQAPSVGAGYVDNALKTIEALIGGGLFREARVFPTDSEEFNRKSNLRKTGEDWLQDWLENKFGSEGENASDYMIHQKVSRKCHPAGSEDGDRRETITRQ